MALALTGDSNNAEAVFAPLLAENGLPIYTTAQLVDQDNAVNNPLGGKKLGSVVLQQVSTNTEAATGASAAASVVITVAATAGLVVGGTVLLSGFVGMTELNGLTGTITAVVTDTSVTLNIDSTGFTAYVSGGVLNVQTMELMYSTGSHQNSVWETLDAAGTGVTPA